MRFEVLHSKRKNVKSTSNIHFHTQIIHTGKANLKKTTALWGTASYIESIKGEWVKWANVCVPVSVCTETKRAMIPGRAGDCLHWKQLLFYFKVVFVVGKGSEELFFSSLSPSSFSSSSSWKMLNVQIAFGFYYSFELHQQHFKQKTKKKCICDEYN